MTTMHANVRRYEGIDESRKAELTKKVDQTLLPRLSKMPGFGGYFLIESEKGVFTSIGLYETSAQADESWRVASKWLKDEKLESLLPNPPKVSSGSVVAHAFGPALV